MIDEYEIKLLVAQTYSVQAENIKEAERKAIDILKTKGPGARLLQIYKRGVEKVA